MTKAELTEDKLTLLFKFPFHVKQFNNSKNKAIISSILTELGHENLDIEASLQTKEEKETKKDKSVESINNIFGSSEVIES